MTRELSPETFSRAQQKLFEKAFLMVIFLTVPVFHLTAIP